MFYEPAQTQYDLNFQIRGIPIRISPWFWLLTIFLGMNLRNPQSLLLWTAAVTISILIHEIGHAWAMRTYGIQPRIVLYGFGGLTIFNRTYHLRWFENAFISFAGPAAGFLFLAALTAVFLLLGQTEILTFFFGSIGLGSLAPINAGAMVNEFLFYLFQVNLFWGILNLMPIYPLDGGQIVREFCMNRFPTDGLHRSLKISMVTGIILAVWFFFSNSTFAAILFGWMAFSNYQILQQISSRRNW